MKFQLSPNPDVLGKIQGQSRIQQHKIYIKLPIESGSQKKIVGLYYTTQHGFVLRKKL
jgi:hypothetical protein